MKKLIYLIVLTLILGLVLTGCLSNVGQVPTNEQSGITYLTKGTEAEPDVFTLYAGQNIDVGNVEVWNDTVNLYVKYVADDPWCLTETHLHVATSLGVIPQKNGNPIPGKFDYKDEHDCVADCTYTIPLAGPDVKLFIAAHAVVERTETGTFMPELTWQRSLEPDSTLFFPGYGATWTPTEAFAIPLDPNQTVWDNGLYFNNLVPIDHEWASWEYAYNNGGSYDGYSDLRRFHATFTVPAGYTVTGGSLYAPHFTNGIPINDNIYIFLNGSDNLIFWGGTRVTLGQIPNTFLGVTGHVALLGTVEPEETVWYIPCTIPGVTGFVSGGNFIDIFTEENERWGGMGKLILELNYEKTYSESAWAVNGEGLNYIGSLPFPGNNWATYFTYELEEVLIETVTVFPNGTNCCSSVLETGKKYRLEASGTYRFANWGEAGIADAKYSLRIQGSYNPGPGPQWISGDVFPVPYTNYLELWVNGIPQDWTGDYISHIYSMDYDGDGSPVCFSILDDAYGDNSGSLTVDIYWIP